MTDTSLSNKCEILTSTLRFRSTHIPAPRAISTTSIRRLWTSNIITSTSRILYQKNSTKKGKSVDSTEAMKRDQSLLFVKLL